MSKGLIDNETLHLIILLIGPNPFIKLREIKLTFRETLARNTAFYRKYVVSCRRWWILCVCGILCARRDVLVERNTRVKNMLTWQHIWKWHADWMFNEGINCLRVYIHGAGFNMLTRRTYSTVEFRWKKTEPGNTEIPWSGSCHQFGAKSFGKVQYNKYNAYTL